MNFELVFTDVADESLTKLQDEGSKKARLKAVQKCLGFLETNPMHPSLNSKPFHTLRGPNKEKVFESYAQNKTPGAYRIFWYYHNTKPQTIVIAAIEPHA